VRILAALMTLVFSLSFLSLNGDVCSEDSAVITSLEQKAHGSVSEFVSASPGKDAPSSSGQPVHLCHCGHTFQILSNTTSADLNHKFVDPSIRRWPRTDEKIVSRSLSPLLRPPIYS
jgi:hypothetical protein